MDEWEYLGISGLHLLLFRAFGASWISQGLFGDFNDSFFVFG